EVALEVVKLMGETYRDRQELIARVTEDEEVRFRATLKRGLKILEDRFGEMRSRGETMLAAEPAADLYTTYGFPLGLTEVICTEASFSVDVEGAKAIVGGAQEAEGPIEAKHQTVHLPGEGSNCSTRRNESEGPLPPFMPRHMGLSCKQSHPRRTF